MKTVFILGARGYHASYGGWETFVTNLIDNYHDKDTLFYVSELSENINELKQINNNLIIDSINIKSKSNLKMFLYAIKSLNNTIKYIEENKIENAYIYILGLKMLTYLKYKRRKLKSLGAQIIVNPDGLEWKRSKWNSVAKKFFLISEKSMLKASDLIICDSIGIKDYIKETYPKMDGKTTYIAYGSNTYDFSKVNEEKILKEYNLKKDDYCLVVGRCVPENNFELIISEFMKSDINKKLVIISNLSSSNYYNELSSKLNCSNDKRLVFINGIYDQIKLSTIRKNAYLYIHGHSVGGTNPSLIEALSLTKMNLLYDVNFNRYVGLDSCLYFKEDGSLTKILNNSKKIEKIRDEKGILAKKIINDNFTWEIIVNKYKDIFK